MTDRDAEAVLGRIPGKLKEARQARGLSLDAVAKLSGVSRSMVSQIERGESNPTVATLWNLTRALQVDFAGLLDLNTAAREIEVVRAAQAPTITGHGRGCHITILSEPENVGRYEVYDIRFTPRGALESEPHGSGAREHLTVLDGSLTVRSGDTEETLRPGDTARYAADRPHAIHAEEQGARCFLIVETP
ncbi:helix-turn-helix domain-containing protein [Salipiger sp. P9]|uniref:helix-turn-helix domain-containing protein n=1 Tax=Salipiger pentaromativorans TaxID=2943193 RepID=UPI002157512B|nr:helix-turn-helix domain-containing protein [Salipiger pentaromativorans]MCR8546243.1 helix-turn-helix domain-containing protein [Salipiger pentaromativorans]